MNVLLNLCDTSSSLRVFLVIKVAFSLICVITFLTLFFRYHIPFIKIIIKGEGFSEEVSGLVKSTVAAFIVLLLPSLMGYVFEFLVEYDTSTISACFDKATIANIDSLQKKEEQKLKDYTDELQQGLDESIEYARQEAKRKEEERKKEAERKKQEEEERRRQEAQQANNNGNGNNNNGSNGGSGGGVTGPSSNPGTVTIFVGDSRTVGLCATKTGDWSGCQFSKGGAKYSGSDIYIAEGSKGYSWFNSTAVPAINSIINSNPNTRYNIVSFMGVNFLLYDIDKYIPTYNSLATGAWSKHNVVLVSVNPVNEAIESKHGYSTKNADIVTFNNKLRDGVRQSNVRYCDTYSSLVNNIGTSDGLHYDGATYNRIYSLSKACI